MPSEIEVLQNKIIALESQLKDLNSVEHLALENAKSQLGFGAWSFEIESQYIKQIVLSEVLIHALFLGKNKKPNFLDLCNQININIREQFKKKIQQSIFEKIDFKLELKLNHSIEKVFIWYGKPVLDENGKIVKLIGVCQDVSSHNSILRSLMHKESDLQLVQSIANIGIWRFNIEKKKLFLNKWASKLIVNEDQAQFIKLVKLKEYFDPQNWKELLHFFFTSFRKKTIGSLETCLNISNKSRTLMLFFEIDKIKNDKVSIVGTVQDVSSSKTIREELFIKTKHERVISNISNYLVNLKIHEIMEGLKFTLKKLFDYFKSDLTSLSIFPNYAIESYQKEISIDKDKNDLLSKEKLYTEIKNIILNEIDFESENYRQILHTKVENSCEKLNLFFEDFVVVPLMVDVYPIGFLFISFRDYSVFKMDEDFDFLNTIVEILSVTIRRKKYEEDLIKKDEDILLVINNINDSLIAIDLEKIITRVNDSARNLVDLPDKKIIGKHFNLIYKFIDSGLNAQTLEEHIDIAFSSKRRIQIKGDLVYINSDGSFITLSIDINPVKNKQGELIGGVLLLRDISNEVKLEEQLRHSEKMRAIGQLSGGIAHDFNNLLTGIVGCANILKKKINDDSLVTYIDDILSVSKRAAGLTSQLLIFGRQEKPRFDVINVSEIIDEVVDLLSYAVNDFIEIKYNKLIEKVYIEGDFSQLQNAILNLALNAKDAISEKGNITIDLATTVIKNVEMKDYFFSIDVDDIIKIEIRDTGCGIPSSILDHIFEPFFTTKEKGKGTGLGLSTVYATIKNHKGNIKVDSVVGQGTVFTILLPIFKRSSTNIFEQPNLKNIISKPTILVVDDDLLLLSLAEETLLDAGFKVFIANNGPDAINIYQEKMSEISLVLLDVLMPKMRGDEVYKNIKKLNPAVKVIFASGFTDTRFGEEEEEWMQEPFIQKPYDETSLISYINKAIGKQ